jgi:hypothetical protein
VSARPRSLVAVSDYREGWPPQPALPAHTYQAHWHATPPIGAGLAADERERLRASIRVVGGYMERLPLAAVKSGLVDAAEKWHYTRSHQPGAAGSAGPLFGWRAFHLPGESEPYHSPDMLAYLECVGAPDVLCTWGLGVSAEILDACPSSVKVYYSIDAPPLRIPPDVSARYDLILVGGEWQRDEVLARHPHMACEILTIGPEFADPETFRPLGTPKTHDLVYAACAQPYKRHEVMFRAMAEYRDIYSEALTALCVIGYGHTRPELEAMAHDHGLEVEFIGPPGLDYAGVNAQIGRARIGIVAGERDGCPAILTEYALADVPVLANAALCCGLRLITPESGRIAPAEAWPHTLRAMLAGLDRFSPRASVIDAVAWPRSIARFTAAIRRLEAARAGRRLYPVA